MQQNRTERIFQIKIAVEKCDFFLKKLLLLFQDAFPKWIFLLELFCEIGAYVHRI